MNGDEILRHNVKFGISFHVLVIFWDWNVARVNGFQRLRMTFLGLDLFSTFISTRLLFGIECLSCPKYVVPETTHTAHKVQVLRTKHIKSMTYSGFWVQVLVLEY